MTAYYNEFDPKAAAWLRQLVAGGHIAPGDVDERDIRDIRPNELRGYNQCHFFAGIGGWSLALRRAGWADDRPVWTGSCPCQPFSAAGKRGGTADERHLWPAFFHLIDQCRPPVVFGEQVASKDGLGWFDLVSADLEGSGYAVGASDLCAAGVGAPHIRSRLWFVGVDHTGGLGRVGRGPGVASGRAALAATERPSDADRLADPIGERGRGGQPGREDAGDAWVAGEAVRMADSHGDGREPGRSLRPIRAEHDAEHGGAVGLVADADGRDARAEREQSGGQQRQRQQPQDGGTGRVGDPRGAAGERDTGSVPAPEAREHGAGQSVDGRLPVRSEHASAGVGGRQPGPVNGVWRDADWLYCRDGKWRPVEPGTFPLAHGIPGRVGLLRGYGNAIVPEAAQAFIEACLDTETLDYRTETA